MNGKAVLIRIFIVRGIVGPLSLAGCGGGTGQSLNNLPPNRATPVITVISPNSAVAGGPAFRLTINGMNFTAASIVIFGGTARATTFVSATQLTAAIDATAITSTGTAAVAVTNPAPGGGTSNAVNFTIAAVGTSGVSPGSVAVDPTGKFAYVANAASNNVINATTGTLTSIGMITAGSGPSSIAIHPSCKFAYVTNSGSNDVSMYSIDTPTGVLTLIGTIGT